MILEAPGTYSHIPLREVCFGAMRRLRAGRDEGAAELPDIPVSDRCIDVGAPKENARGSVISSCFNTLHAKGVGALASTVAANRKAFDNRL